MTFDEQKHSFIQSNSVTLKGKDSHQYQAWNLEDLRTALYQTFSVAKQLNIPIPNEKFDKTPIPPVYNKLILRGEVANLNDGCLFTAEFTITIFENGWSTAPLLPSNIELRSYSVKSLSDDHTTSQAKFQMNPISNSPQTKSSNSILMQPTPRSSLLSNTSNISTVKDQAKYGSMTTATTTTATDTIVISAACTANPTTDNTIPSSSSNQDMMTNSLPNAHLCIDKDYFALSMKDSGCFMIALQFYLPMTKSISPSLELSSLPKCLSSHLELKYRHDGKEQRECQIYPHTSLKISKPKWTGFAILLNEVRSPNSSFLSDNNSDGSERNKKSNGLFETEVMADLGTTSSVAITWVNKDINPTEKKVKVSIQETDSIIVTEQNIKIVFELKALVVQGQMDLLECEIGYLNDGWSIDNVIGSGIQGWEMSGECSEIDDSDEIKEMNNNLLHSEDLHGETPPDTMLRELSYVEEDEDISSIHHYDRTITIRMIRPVSTESSIRIQLNLSHSIPSIPGLTHLTLPNLNFPNADRHRKYIAVSYGNEVDVELTWSGHLISIMDLPIMPLDHFTPSIAYYGEGKSDSKPAELSIKTFAKIIPSSHLMNKNEWFAPYSWLDIYLLSGGGIHYRYISNIIRGNGKRLKLKPLKDSLLTFAFLDDVSIQPLDEDGYWSFPFNSSEGMIDLSWLCPQSYGLDWHLEGQFNLIIPEINVKTQRDFIRITAPSGLEYFIETKELKRVSELALDIPETVDTILMMSRSKEHIVFYFEKQSINETKENSLLVHYRKPISVTTSKENKRNDDAADEEKHWESKSVMIKSNQEIEILNSSTPEPFSSSKIIFMTCLTTLFVLLFVSFLIYIFQPELEVIRYLIRINAFRFQNWIVDYIQKEWICGREMITQLFHNSSTKSTYYDIIPYYWMNEIRQWIQFMTGL